jgi:two-component system phosphate regulon response regulator PhoB
MIRVLIVDDEADVGRLLSFNLAAAGFETAVATTGAEALALAAGWRPRIVLLDLMLPDVSGLEVCRRVRGQAAGGEGDVGVIVVSARGDEYDRIAGLEVGADDYVTKPFSVREVVLRVQGLCKRIAERSAAAGGTAPGKLLRAGDLELDLRSHEVRVAGQPLGLRPLEFRLLATLLADPGRAFSRDELMAEVWGVHEVASTRTVDVHINRLRANLGRAAAVIETVHGFGYRALRA